MWNQRCRAVLSLTFVAAIVGLSNGAAAAEDQPATARNVAKADRWELFRGDLAMTGIAASALPDNLELLWQHATNDSIESTAAIADGVVYIATMDGRMIALQLADGKELWTFVNEDKDPVKSSPCIADNVICYGDEIGKFRGIDRKTGKLLWTVETDGEVISSPVYVDGKVLFGSYDEKLYCLDAKTGKTAWTFQTQGPVHCSPSFVDNQVVVAGCDGFIRLVSVSDGKETAALEVGGNIASTPAILGDRLFVGTMSNQVLCIEWKTMTKAWMFEDPKRAFPYYSSPALANGLVFIGGRDKMLHGLVQSTGKERWAYRTKARIDSSPVVVGDRVFFGSNDGTIQAVEATTGSKRWEFVTGAPVSASPAVADGRLVIGDQDGNLYCFGKK